VEVSRTSLVAGEPFLANQEIAWYCPDADIAMLGSGSVWDVEE